MSKINVQWEEQTLFWQTSHDRLSESGTRLWWCSEDARNQIWAQFNRKTFRIENCSDDLIRILTTSLPVNHYGATLSEALIGFILMVVQNIILLGRISFALRLGWNPSTDPRDLVRVQINFIPSGSLLRIGRKIFQVIPSGVDPMSNRRTIRLNPDRIIEFLPPRHWQCPLNRIRKELPLLERSQNRFMGSILEEQQGETFKSVQRRYNVQIAKLTSPIGWNARGLLQNEMASFQWIMRELQWRRFCIELRDEVLERINKCFLAIGKLRGERPILIWEHLPTVKDCQEGVKKIMNGQARFNEVLKPFRISR